MRGCSEVPTLQLPPLPLSLAQERSVLGTSCVKVLERLAVWLWPGCSVDELDGQVRGEVAIVLDIGEYPGRVLLVRSLQHFEQVSEGSYAR